MKNLVLLIIVFGMTIAGCSNFNPSITKSNKNTVEPITEPSLPESTAQKQSISDKLCEKLWYSPEDAMIAHWKYFSKTGKYKQWNDGEVIPDGFTGSWKLDEQNEEITIKETEYNQSETFSIKKLNDQEFEIMSTGISAGPILYKFKGSPANVD